MLRDVVQNLAAVSILALVMLVRLTYKIVVIGGIILLIAGALLQTKTVGLNIQSWLVENWLNISICVLLLKVISIERKVRKIGDELSHARLMIGTMMKYFDVEISTPELEKFSELGIADQIGLKLRIALSGFFFGAIPPDYALTGRPVRRDEDQKFYDNVITGLSAMHMGSNIGLSIKGTPVSFTDDIARARGH